jgi:hypothetical protein
MADVQLAKFTNKVDLDEDFVNSQQLPKGQVRLKATCVVCLPDPKKLF